MASISWMRMPGMMNFGDARGKRSEVYSRAMVSAVQTLSARGIDLEVLRRGAGRPVVLLHGFRPVDPRWPVVDLLAGHVEVIAPSHPGFGRSPRPEGFDSVYDLVHLYLDLLDSLPYDRMTLVGLSFGGWLAAEIAVTCSHRLERLVLVDALGIKISDRETPDILDVFNTSPREVQRRSWHDPVRWAPDFDAMTDDELVIHHRNWESLCLYGWHPYMYNPKLLTWLGRVSVPTLVLWGESDGIVAPAYGRAYAAAIPGARFETIAGAGHHPHVERPEALVDRLAAFVKE
jgi:pimeloyl-ACP methyl ester carboxylesterase